MARYEDPAYHDIVTIYIYIYKTQVAKISLAWIKRQVNVTRLTGISTTNPSTEGWGRSGDEGMIYERVDSWMERCTRLVVKLNACRPTIKPP